MRHFFGAPSPVCRLTSCMVNASLLCTLIPLACFPERSLSPTLCTCLAAIPLAMITRTANYCQLSAAGFSTGEYAGTVVLHPSLAEGTGQHPL